jgi:hypothetical protein
MTRTVKLASAGTLLVLVAAAACSSSSTPGNIQSACNITGMYKVHYSLKAGDAGACPTPADLTIDLTPKDAGSTGGDAGASPCTTSTDTSTCTATASCVTDVAGYKSTTSSSTTFASDGSSGTGTSSSKTVKDSDGSVLSDCSFDITYTRQ